MRLASRTDSNHSEIVKAFRDAGCTVQSLAAVGKGCPDLLIGFRGINVLVELKDGEKKPSAQKLTTDQIDWHGTWGGQVSTANSVEQAIEIVVAEAKMVGRL